jgi:hypothetical protein
MIFAIDEQSYEPPLRGRARDKLSTVQFPARRQCMDQADARAGEQAQRLWVVPTTKCERWSGTNVAQAGCLMGLSQTEEHSNVNSDRDGPHWRYPASF